MANKYKRVLVKLSGEALQDKQNSAILDSNKLNEVAVAITKKSANVVRSSIFKTFNCLAFLLFNAFAAIFTMFCDSINFLLSKHSDYML